MKTKQLLSLFTLIALTSFSASQAQARGGKPKYILTCSVEKEFSVSVNLSTIKGEDKVATLWGGEYDKKAKRTFITEKLSESATVVSKKLTTVDGRKVLTQISLSLGRSGSIDISMDVDAERNESGQTVGEGRIENNVFRFASQGSAPAQCRTSVISPKPGVSGSN